MGFSKRIKEEILVSSARHCCVCHKATGLNIEVHHIQPKNQGGGDVSSNAIALCFNCHADAGHYFAEHPKGSKLSPEELKKHKLFWFEIVKQHKIRAPKDASIELSITNENFKGVFYPKFTQEETRFLDRESLKKIYELTGEDPMDNIKKRIQNNSPFSGTRYDPYLNKIKSYDDYLNYLNRDDFELKDEQSDSDCQPISYKMDMIPRLYSYTEINRSNCVLNISIKNIGDCVLEDFKLYLKFQNVINVDSVNKRREYFDNTRYFYNITFNDKLTGEFIPDSNILVQNDSIQIDPICFRCKSSVNDVIVHWELFARNIQSKGEIKIKIEPLFEISDNIKFVDKDELKEPLFRILPYYEFE